MRHFKNTLAILLLAGSSTLQARWPASSFPESGKTNSMTVFRHVGSFAVVQKATAASSSEFVFTAPGKVDKEYVSGMVKREKSMLARVLHWDMKVKFRLNKNMNMIFCYEGM